MLTMALATGVWLLSGPLAAAAQPPVCADPRLVIELVAQEPVIVTPTGLAVDDQNRIWVIENNTHQRPADYRGPTSDRVRIFSALDAQGKAQRVETFAEGFRNAMGLALGRNGTVFLATRSDIFRMSQKDGQLAEKQVIVRLDTPGDYPHNGLSGFAIDALDQLYFGLGENLGAPYRLIGSDGITISGGGEGGNIFRCRPDGTGLVRVATGFWNPFGLGFDAFGRLFAVDNDPDSRGPCRLLHIIPGGDYGYRFRNGRKGLHPFTAWNGELPGTLPMVAGTAEAPCAVLPYESDGLPPEYRGQLLVTSWGDHVIERYQLTPRGASFASKAQPLVRGGEDFRPVGLVTGPDGALYFSDWMDKSYPVHGKGRIWRLRMRQPPPAAPFPDHLEALLGHPRREVRLAAGRALAELGRAGVPILQRMMADASDVRTRVHALWAAARLPAPERDLLLRKTLGDQAPKVRAEAVRLLGEGASAEARIMDEPRFLTLALRDPEPSVRLQAILQLRQRKSQEALVPLLADLDPFIAAAALDRLGRPKSTGLLVSLAANTDARLRLGVLLALRRGATPAGRALLPQFLQDADPGVRRAAIQWVGEERLRAYEPMLAASAARRPVTREVFEALLAAREFLAGTRRQPTEEVAGDDYVAAVVADTKQPPALRAIALRMLRPDHPALKISLLQEFLNGSDRNFRQEAIRTLILRTDSSSQDLLRSLAADANQPLTVRADAILGLAASASTPESQKVLLRLLEEPALQVDAIRSLRGVPDAPRLLERWWATQDKVTGPAHAETAAQLHLLSAPGQTGIGHGRPMQPRTEAEWRTALASAGDPVAGARVFFHPNGPRCFVCHRVDGRGGAIGPDLSTIGRSLSRAKLIDSILTPSKEIAPQFTSWMLTLRNGQVRTGMIVEEGPNSTITLADNQGKLTTFNRTDVEDRRALPTSIMPEKLADLMTITEFRDLLAFLTSRQ